MNSSKHEAGCECSTCWFQGIMGISDQDPGVTAKDFANAEENSNMEETIKTAIAAIPASPGYFTPFGIQQRMAKVQAENVEYIDPYIVATGMSRERARKYLEEAAGCPVAPDVIVDAVEN